MNVRDPDRSATELISQSSTEIWQAVCKVVREVSAGVNVALIKAIGFDATCSLVVVGPGGFPVEVDGVLRNPLIGGEDGQQHALDVIMWQDHRAK